MLPGNHFFAAFALKEDLVSLTRDGKSHLLSYYVKYIALSIFSNYKSRCDLVRIGVTEAAACRGIERAYHV